MITEANPREELESAYVAAHATALALLAAITSDVEDMPALGEAVVNWGHVGDLNRIVKLLEAVKESLPQPTWQDVELAAAKRGELIVLARTASAIAIRWDNGTESIHVDPADAIAAIREYA